MATVHLWTDASVRPPDRSTAVGFLIEDERGELLGAFGYPLEEYHDSTTAEYLAIIHGLEHTLEVTPARTVHIHTDATSVLRVLSEEHDDMTDCPRLQGFVFRVRQLFERFDDVKLHDVPSEENPAHALATSGNASSQTATADD